jgi:hypothetical protein
MTWWTDMAIHNSKPLAFLSYHSFNDEVDKGAISAFSLDLSNEVKVQTGKDFPIFQDRKDVKWGEYWSTRIDDGIKSATFFIAILTPGYFKSPHCVSEVRTFLKYEKQMERQDLILPVVYVSPKPLGSEQLVYGHRIEKEIFKHQWVDWTTLRFSDSKDPKRKNRIVELARDIKSAILRTVSHQSNGEPFKKVLKPKRIVADNENNPFDVVLGICDDDNPRTLLQRAKVSKAQHRYEEAKKLHDKIVACPFEWVKNIDFFIDHVYFSVSLLDKLEEWQELKRLEQQLYKPVFAKLRSMARASKFTAMTTMFDASMALCLLREGCVNKALLRIQSAVEYPPALDDDLNYSLLYANALVTRALIQHAKYIYEVGPPELLLAARSDLVASEVIYHKHAKMGTDDEYHFLGRFYGARAFVLVAEHRAKGENLSSVAKVLLEDCRRAHEGITRRGYGRIAGKYSHAYCLFELASDVEEDVRTAHLIRAIQLLREARATFDKLLSLGRCKVAGLSELVLQTIGDGDLANELAEVRAERAAATDCLRAKCYQLLAQIDRPEWLRTPLN